MNTAVYDVGVGDAARSFALGSSAHGIHLRFSQNFYHQGTSRHKKLLYQGASRLLKGLDNTNDPCTRSDHGSTPWSEATQGSATVHEAAIDLDNKERRGNRGQRLLFGSSALDAEKPPV